MNMESRLARLEQLVREQPPEIIVNQYLADYPGINFYVYMSEPERLKDDEYCMNLRNKIESELNHSSN